jgi:hypothetical protein
VADPGGEERAQAKSGHSHADQEPYHSGVGSGLAIYQRGAAAACGLHHLQSAAQDSGMEESGHPVATCRAAGQAEDGVAQVVGADARVVDQRQNLLNGKGSRRGLDHGTDGEGDPVALGCDGLGHQGACLAQVRRSRDHGKQHPHIAATRSAGDDA